MTSESSPGRAFQLVAGHPALDFINTLDWRFRKTGSEELLKSYHDLLRFAEQSNLLSQKQARQILRSISESKGLRVLESCTELREAMADLFYATIDGLNPGAESLKTLERYFKAARNHQQLCAASTRLEWKWREAQNDPEIPLWLLSQNAADLMTSDSADRVRACDNDECRWLFLDTSKNHTRRWCDMKICGNRMKARRFKAQQRA
jgi:predicted RNA-binding Zn ribbon-like protein